jgi:hypothetical protein
MAVFALWRSLQAGCLRSQEITPFSAKVMFFDLVKEGAGASNPS